MRTQATARPWMIGCKDKNGDIMIYSKGKIPVAIIKSEDSNLNLIVRAVNGHDDLIRAINTVANELQVWVSHDDSRSSLWAKRRLNILKTALSKIKEK